MNLLENFRLALIEAGVSIRKPQDAGKDHPIWLEPRGGAIAPGETENEKEDDAETVLSAFRMPGLGTGAYEGDTYRYDNVEVRIRTMRPPAAFELEEAMREVLHDRRNWDMAEIRVIESMVFLELAPIGTSSDQGSTFRVEYSIQRYLTDQPE